MHPPMFPQNKVRRRVSGIEQVFVMWVACVIKESCDSVNLFLFLSVWGLRKHQCACFLGWDAGISHVTSHCGMVPSFCDAFQFHSSTSTQICIYLYLCTLIYELPYCMCFALLESIHCSFEKLAASKGQSLSCYCSSLALSIDLIPIFLILLTFTHYLAAQEKY